MVATRLRKFGSMEDAELFLRGSVASGPIEEAGPSNTTVYGLNGLTLVFTTPSHTVTFSDTSMGGLSLSAIVAQITAVLGVSANVKIVSRRIIITEASPTTGVVLSNTSTALAKLGFDPAGVSGKVYAPPDGTAPRWLDISTFGPSESLIMVATEE